MLVGLLSDTHDNASRTRRALELLSKRDPAFLVHAGDLHTGKLLDLFEGHRVWLARGNVDHTSRIRSGIETVDADVRYGAKHEVEAGTARIGVIHGDDQPRLQSMINAGVFDLIVHGHTHEFRDERVGGTRVVNPGAVHRASTPSVCVYETESDELERIELG